MTSHTISIYVVNKPGVLSRVTQVFARRGFNIDSLVVSPGIKERFSRMTVTAKGNKENLTQIIAQVNKLIDVVKCEEHNDQECVSEELALIKITFDEKNQHDLLQVIESYDCKKVDSTADSIIIKASGDSLKLDVLIEKLKPYEIIEIIRTGKIAIMRGTEST